MTWSGGRAVKLLMQPAGFIITVCSILIGANGESCPGDITSFKLACNTSDGTVALDLKETELLVGLCYNVTDNRQLFYKHDPNSHNKVALKNIPRNCSPCKIMCEFDDLKKKRHGLYISVTFIDAPSTTINYHMTASHDEQFAGESQKPWWTKVVVLVTSLVLVLLLCAGGVAYKKWMNRNEEEDPVI